MDKKESDVQRKEKDIQLINLVKERLDPPLNQILKEKCGGNKSEFARVLGFQSPKSINALLKGTGWSIGNILRLCVLDQDFRDAAVKLILDVKKKDMLPREQDKGEWQGAGNDK